MRSALTLVSLVLFASLVACTSEPIPRNEAKKDALTGNAQSAITTISADVSNFRQLLDDAYGYVIFPEVGKAGLIVGGAYGRGEVYERGNFIGYADITQMTLGLQAGGQTYAEVILFQNKEALDRFTSNKYEPTAQASAIALKSGASAVAKYTDGVAIFSHAGGGLMGELAVGGQRFRFTPQSEADMNRQQ